jgi:Tfp pilus assembly protein PilX
MFFDIRGHRKQRGMILPWVLVMVFILGIFAVQSQRVALHFYNEVRVVKSVQAA